MIEYLNNLQDIITRLDEKDKKRFLDILLKLESEYMISNRYPPLSNTYAT